ncbi:hypothetical protein NDU88_006391 [Pleurodeles waltl]|uniref:Uncharacterized protein n=1 Tax=Pleurodeles waltl TaxID=8319 RepID=A0AAV7X062_PLEWA|nr:hypothetical protein NDU88_006391 [Pleurodeles waltl]
MIGVAAAGKPAAGSWKEVPATTREKSGTDSRLPYPCSEGVGNPSGQLPEHLPGYQDNADANNVTGNPDIRVPERMKRDEGLHAAEVPKKEDAGRGEKGDQEGNQGEDERTNPVTPMTCSVKDTTTKEEAVEG